MPQSRTPKKSSGDDDRTPLVDNGDRQPKKQKCITIFLRIVEILFLLTIISCIAQADRLCAWFGVYSACQSVPLLYIINWKTISNYLNNSSLIGLYWSFSTEVFALLLAVILFFCACVDYRHKIPEVLCIVLALIFAIISACLMTWYSMGWWGICYLYYYGPPPWPSGFGIPCDQQWYMVETWVAAAVFLYILSIIYLIDAIITGKTAPRRTRIQREPKKERPPPGKDTEEIQYVEKNEKPRTSMKSTNTEKQEKTVKTTQVQPADYGRWRDNNASAYRREKTAYTNANRSAKNPVGVRPDDREKPYNKPQMVF